MEWEICEGGSKDLFYIESEGSIFSIRKKTDGLHALRTRSWSKDGDFRSMLVDKDGEITLPWNGELFSPLRNEPIVIPHNPSLRTASL